MESIKTSDFVIFLQDNAKICEDYAKILEESPQNFARVLNKIDQNTDFDPKKFDLCISCKDGTGIEELKELIYQKTVDQTLLSEKLIITNLRHGKLLSDALKSLEQALSDLDKVSIELTQVLLKQAWELLGEITGVVSNETIIDTIFSKFCLGK